MRFAVGMRAYGKAIGGGSWGGAWGCVLGAGFPGRTGGGGSRGLSSIPWGGGMVWSKGRWCGGASWWWVVKRCPQRRGGGAGFPTAAASPLLKCAEWFRSAVGAN
jgi:hypothetical protein